MTSATQLKDTCSLGEKRWQTCRWVASVVSDSVRPHRRQPTRLPHPWDFPDKNAGVGCHFLLQGMKVKSESEVARQHIKKQRLHLANQGLYSQKNGFSISHIWMWELDHKEGWAPKNWCFQIVVLEKTLERLESPLDCKEIKPVNSKGNQCWILIGRTDAEAEAPIC